MSFRYIGSKARLVSQLAQHIGTWKQGSFVDVFCGTGAVAEIAGQMGWPVRLNDQLSSATTVAAARLFSSAQTTFDKLGGYENAIAALQRSKPKRGFIWREYSPASKKIIGFERRYFTEANAAKIDGVRKMISEWRAAGQVNRDEEVLLIADLLSASNRVANIAGTYGCFLAKWTPQASQKLNLRARELKPFAVEVAISNDEASDVVVNPKDLVYLDPPYTKRQYASYYHILETIALGDSPAVEGVSGLRPWKSLASDYCYKVRALNALTTLIAKLPAERMLLSYSNEGHVDLDSLTTALRTVGTVAIHELATVGRYRPNVTASATRSSVNEFLIVVEKRVSVSKPRKRELAVA